MTKTEEMPSVLGKFPAVIKYLTIAEMWCNWGRRFYYEDHETNNLVER